MAEQQASPPRTVQIEVTYSGKKHEFPFSSKESFKDLKQKIRPLFPILSGGMNFNLIQTRIDGKNLPLSSDGDLIEAIDLLLPIEALTLIVSLDPKMPNVPRSVDK